MDAKPVEALAAERRDERRVNVDYPALVSAREVRAQYAHVAREDYQVYIIFFEYFNYFFFNSRLTAEFFLADRDALDSRFRRAFERVGVRVARNDQLYLAVLDYSAFLRVDKSLEIRSAAGDKNGDFSFACFHFFSPPIRVSAGRSIPPSELPITTASMNSAALNEKMPDAPK